MDLEKYTEVQALAKTVMAELPTTISPESTESTIADTATELMCNMGITETWYYNAPAFVLLGTRSCVSISGKDYKPANEKVGKTNLVSVDLSPLMGIYWGDFARSFPIENGVYAKNPDSEEFKNGLSMEYILHDKMKNYVTPNTKFSDLYYFGNDLISEYGFENLDFLSNLGHSIEIDKSHRRYIDKDCHELLGRVSYFTFEPHIKNRGGSWGYKHENIYYFNSEGVVMEL